jgi:hypothetical protein
LGDQARGALSRPDPSLRDLTRNRTSLRNFKIFFVFIEITDPMNSGPFAKFFSVHSDPCGAPPNLPGIYFLWQTFLPMIEILLIENRIGFLL